MRIHFVCTGNVYRSRLAEAYINSKRIDQLTVSSSGTEASDNTCGPICWYTQRIIEACGLVPYEFPHWRQTTSESFSDVDFVVFMEEMHYKYAVAECGFKGDRFEIWHVPDLDELHTLDVSETVEAVRVSEQTFELIKGRVNALVEKLGIFSPGTW
ncbi:MAG: hypothetical protein M3Q44_05200 [bacterium]|nr:hypothetical protein [bacterium]